MWAKSQKIKSDHGIINSEAIFHSFLVLVNVQLISVGQNCCLGMLAANVRDCVERSICMSGKVSGKCL